MREHDMSQQIKEIRKHYGLSQQAFARLLGIGEASITRYEKGIAPTKANANLIRAAMIPAFMAPCQRDIDLRGSCGSHTARVRITNHHTNIVCLERDGDALTPKQRASVEKIVYAEVTFDEGGDVMDTTEIYEITLQQEVLNESAWDIMAQISRARAEAKLKGNDELTIIYDDIEQQIARLVPEILSDSAANQHAIDEIRGQLKGFQQFLSTQLAKAA